ncbi:MAG: hypothetical protein M0C28_06270 [Candidatus Moduliflexus flocculans]|nr:hypothetical protein [Candidatus Moduliflexus flocculans]
MVKVASNGRLIIRPFNAGAIIPAGKEFDSVIAGIGRGDPRRSRLGDRLFPGFGLLQQRRRRPDQEPDAAVAAERGARAGPEELHSPGSLLCRPAHAAQRRSVGHEQEAAEIRG